MDTLVETPVFKFHSDTLESVRKELCLNQPGMIDQSVQLIEDWLNMQDYFTKKDFSRPYLERYIINCKGSVERVKEKLQKLCNLRVTVPHFFDTHDAIADYEPYKEGIVHGLLPTLTPHHERVYFVRNNGTKHHTLLGFFRLFTKIGEYLKLHDYALGIHIILDYTELNILEFATKLNPIDVQNCIAIFIDAFGMRLKSIHIISTSKVIDILISIMKTGMSAKLGNRFHVHKTFEELYQHFPQEILPNDYGGQAESLQKLCDTLIENISTPEFIDYLKEMSKAVSKEYLRKKDLYNEIGMQGSFRQLSLD